MNRWGLAVVVGAVALGLALSGWLAPDVGPAVSLRAPPPPSDAPPTPADLTPPARALTRHPPRPDGWEIVEFSEEDGDPEAGALPFGRQVEPPPPVDPDQEFAPDLRGLASAAVTRRDDMVRCIRSFEQRGGEVPDGRFTIKVTVSPGDGAGVVSTEVVNGSDDVTLGDCLQLTMEDVKFASPEHDFSMMWPIPLPSGDP